MDKKKAEQAKNLLYELERVQEIKDTMEKEAQNRWSFFTPDKQSWKNDGLMMREEFTKAVDRSIERLEKQIEEL